jgi:hypothetical protein
MTKVSMLEASKLFDVSRPTLLKHLHQGKITGEKIRVDKNVFWKLDVTELARLYRRRGEAAPDITKDGTGETASLRAEIKLLEAKLEAEREARALVQAHLDDLRNRLPGPQTQVSRRRWWPF